MSDLGLDDFEGTDDEMLDPHFEKPSLDLLKRIADQMEQSNINMRALAEQMAVVVRLTMADRETQAIGHDGRVLKGISRIKKS